MSNFKKILSIYIIGLHLLLAVILVKSDFVEKVGIKVGVFQTPELSDYYTKLTAHHKHMDGSIPEGATLFIGDSITQGLATSSITDLSVNYGIGSDTTVGVIARLPFYKSISTAKAVVIAIGVNDLGRRDNSNIVENYKKILSLIPENKKVIISAVLPVDERIDSISLSNERIIRLNSNLRELAGNYTNIILIDSRNMFQDSSGNLKSEFHTGDGIHLSAAGYRVWISQLRNALENT